MGCPAMLPPTWLPPTCLCLFLLTLGVKLASNLLVQLASFLPSPLSLRTWQPAKMKLEEFQAMCQCSLLLCNHRDMVIKQRRPVHLSSSCRCAQQEGCMGDAQHYVVDCMQEAGVGGGCDRHPPVGARMLQPHRGSGCVYKAW